MNIRIDSYLLDLEAANRCGGEKKKKNSLTSALLKRRPRISSSGQSKSSNRLNSQDSLEQKFVSKKGSRNLDEADGAAEPDAFVDESNDQEAANSHITYLKDSNKGAAFKKNARTAFCEISKCVGIAFGSLGVITLGAMYIKK